MGTTVKEDSFERKLVPAGVHRAVCVWVIDLGTVINTAYNKEQSKVLIGWELVDEKVTTDDGKTFAQKISKTYTASLDSRAILRQHLDAWRGVPFNEADLKGFELKKVLGASCLLQIMHEENAGKTYANIKSLMALPSGMPTPVAESPLTFFDMDERTPLPKGLPPWLITKITASPEWKDRYANQSSGHDAGCHDPGDFEFGTNPEVNQQQISGGEAALIEARVRRLATQLGKAAQATDLAIATATRRGTLDKLAAELERQAAGGYGDPIAWSDATPPATTPAPPATAAPDATETAALLEDLYALGEDLGMKVREVMARVETVKTAGPAAIKGLHDSWSAQAKKGTAA